MIRGYESTGDNVKKAKNEVERKKGRLKEQSLRVRIMTKNEIMPDSVIVEQTNEMKGKYEYQIRCYT